jgi:hypothetical protein
MVAGPRNSVYHAGPSIGPAGNGVYVNDPAIYKPDVITVSALATLEGWLRAHRQRRFLR